MSVWCARDVLTALTIILLTIILLIYAWFKRAFTYWKNRGVVGPKPSIPFGNFRDVFTGKLAMFEYQKKIYRDYKSERFIGVYMMSSPMLVVNDVEIANRILVQDFLHFESHGPDINEKLDPLGVHLFNASGKEWKELRNKMTPAFTTGKLKGMFLIMEQVGSELQKVFEAPAAKGEEVEVQDLAARFTTDVIGNCAFGVECNSLKDKDAPFRRCGQRIFNHSKFEEMKVALGFFFPEMCSKLGISPQKKDVTEFIFQSITETVKYREENNVRRNDFLDILMRIKNKTLEDDQGNKIDFSQSSGLTTNEFMSQAYLFFVAGFETSSGTTSFALYELACNPDVQARARAQVRAALGRHGGQYTYDAMMEMEYLTNIINETLRMYPPLPMLFRKCTSTYKVPVSELTIEKGTVVFMPIIGMQMDPEFFPEPEKFDPDRYTSEKRHPSLNKIHMPFGQGPRVCIGQRFGMMQSRVALAKLLDKFEFRVGPRTPVPMKFKVGFSMVTPEAGMWLQVGPAPPLTV